MRKLKTTVKFSDKDNVAIVLTDVEAGRKLEIAGETVEAKDSIPYGHKIALVDLKKGDRVFKYGEPVARCIADIPKGSWVHVHNVESIRGLGR